MAGTVLACNTSDLGIKGKGCDGAAAPMRTWTVTNSWTAESIEWSVASNFSGAVTLTPKSAGTWDVQTLASVNTLYVRFKDFTSVHISKVWDGEACPTATPTATPTETPTATPTPTETPFESFQGETGTPVESLTPPPTSTGGNGSSNSSIPLLALLICLAFGGLGIAAVETQRRSTKS
jgi:hypothetical protein